MEASMEELKKDIAELDALTEQATRQKVKDILIIESRKLVTKLCNLQEQVSATASSQSNENEKPVASTSDKRCQVKITDYCYDGDDLEYITFHVGIPNVHKVSNDNVTCKFTKTSVELIARDVDNKDYVFQINNLAYEIVPLQSVWRSKKDRVVIKCAKQSKAKWNFVTQYEKKQFEAKRTSKPDTDENPKDDLFKLIKDMYDSGDDTMKQTISKAWEESHMKQPKF